jgi:hypothetical protein
MKMISKSSGGSTDTTRDHEYTDWPGLERFAGEIIEELREPSVTGEAASEAIPPRL